MSYAPITIAARRVLLDALEALEDHREGLVLVGAQAIYLYTGAADVAIATTTKDSDIALIPIRLTPEPTLDAAMTASGFSHDRSVQQPGEWSSGKALDPPVELLVPEGLHAGGGRRGARIPPHSKYAARVVPGLEAAAVSHRQMSIASLEPDRDARELPVPRACSSRRRTRSASARRPRRTGYSTKMHTISTACCARSRPVKSWLTCDSHWVTTSPVR